MDENKITWTNNIPHNTKTPIWKILCDTHVSHKQEIKEGVVTAYRFRGSKSR